MDDIQVIGVAGSGQMGRGIAQVAAQSGREVILQDLSQELADAARERIAADMSRLIERGKMSADDRDAILSRLRPTGDLAALSRADFIIEAATERQDLKQRVFRQLDEVARPGVVLASNTSSISITLLGAATRRPQRVVGMHFMNPVPQMRLVELVRGLQTDDEAFDVTMHLAEQFGKTVVTCRDIPGFIVNRILLPLINESIYALYEGLGTQEDIDRAARLGLNHPMGPLELADLIGLDTCLAILEVMHREIGEDKYRPCPLLRQYVAAGWLGRKSGRGFYRYQPTRK